MSGVLELTPGAPEIVCVVSRLDDEVLILSLGRERFPEVYEIFITNDVIFMITLTETLISSWSWRSRLGVPCLSHPLEPLGRPHAGPGEG